MQIFLHFYFFNIRKHRFKQYCVYFYQIKTVPFNVRVTFNYIYGCKNTNYELNQKMRDPFINVLFIFMLLLFFNCTKDIDSIPEDIGTLQHHFFGRCIGVLSKSSKSSLRASVSTRRTCAKDGRYLGRG